MIKKFKTINNVFSYSFFEWDTINPIKGNNPNDPIDIFKKNNILFEKSIDKNVVTWYTKKVVADR